MRRTLPSRDSSPKTHTFRRRSGWILFSATSTPNTTQKSKYFDGPDSDEEASGEDEEASDFDDVDDASSKTAAGAIELCAWRSGDRLHVRVRDNGPGLPRGWRLERHIGIGLGNTRARLEQLYGHGEYSLEVVPDDERGTCVDVTFPYRAA